VFAAVLVLGVVMGVPADAPVMNDQNPQVTQPEDPYPQRPVCNSLFLSTEWQLSAKQRVCNWIDNGVFSGPSLAGAVWSAASSPLWNRITRETADDSFGFPRRFAIDFGQNAFKATGAYLGGFILHEDPRATPPFMLMRPASRPRGFFQRTAHALRANVSAYQCVKECKNPDDIKWRLALSKMAGSLASGFSIELLDRGGPDLRTRAIRGSAAAYAATFANSLITEFKPDLSAFAGKLFTILGVR
jgi:hypothetical protein